MAIWDRLFGREERKAAEEPAQSKHYYGYPEGYSPWAESYDPAWVLEWKKSATAALVTRLELSRASWTPTNYRAMIEASFLCSHGGPRSAST